jgi:hypothetical protein
VRHATGADIQGVEADRTSKRVLWVIRLAFLALAAGLLLLAQASRGAAEPEDPIREVRGSTETGGDLVLKFDRASGELRSFDVELDG